jgi:hypothetical protein
VHLRIPLVVIYSSVQHWGRSDLTPAGIPRLS